MKEPPRCSECQHMKLTGSARRTGNNRYLAGVRSYCSCRHPDAEETFWRVCPRSPRMAAFIGFTRPGGYTPTVKTSPRWCPIKNGGQP